MARTFFVFVVIASLTFMLGAAPAGEVLPRAEIDRLLQPTVKGNWVKGLVIGLVNDRDRQVIGYGIKSDQDAMPPDGETVFEIGSISKTFTATLLADAIVRGEVSLDDPVQKYLPADAIMPKGKDGKPITLRHLSTHGSGLPRMPGNFAPADRDNPYADYSLHQMYDFLAAYKLEREPGEKCEYSNLGVALLGNVLARRAGNNFEELLLDRICRPLKMGNTQIGLSNAMRQRLAPPYDTDGNPLKNWDLPTFAGAGGIRSTANDMLQYVSAEIGVTQSDLSAAIELTHQRQQKFDKNQDIGLGWFIERMDGHFWHNGQTGGYHCCVAFDTAKHMGVVVLANSPSDVPDALAGRLLARMLGHEMVPLKLRQTMEIDPNTLDRYVGEYKFSALEWMSVQKVGDHLTARMTGQSAFRIYPESPDNFFLKVADAQITFETDRDGKTVALVLHQNGKDPRADKTK